jgi:hypothetical protein
LTHAVTEHTAHLYYYMQSGALNESYSDIFGETIDLLNGAGDDSAGVRWELGEDLPGGPTRDLMDPTAFGHPGKMSDAEFFCGDSLFADGGGVHVNSGVPNHAFALMVDGGTYNSIVVTGLGLSRAGAIQYRALNHYLLSASDFEDNANALEQACADLVGTLGISLSDCGGVADALGAVEMADPWGSARCPGHSGRDRLRGADRPSRVPYQRRCRRVVPRRPRVDPRLSCDERVAQRVGIQPGDYGPATCSSVYHL